ncbi:MAG: indolepyruvate oxidoreductase subunit beta family protein [Kiloniellales bacterium]
MATLRLLIAALGGEGGGLLTNWIVEAARRQGIAAQATSVPGVAQRTGATTYYVEFATGGEPGRTPVFALMPVAGDVDIVVASELLEAARMVGRGFVAPDRTFLIASTHRTLTTLEKMAPGDGALDAGSLLRAVEGASRACFLFDADSAARGTGAPLNAVLLGALAGLEVLPLSADSLRAAIESGGVAVKRNLRGFGAGFAKARGEPLEPKSSALRSSADLSSASKAGPARRAVEATLERRLAALPEAVRAVAGIAVERLIGYQDADYAALYLERLTSFLDEPVLAREVARHLAVRMSYEDVIRVAQLKTRASRIERIRTEIAAGEADPLEIVDFFKPGIPEIADILPAALGRRLLAWNAKRASRDPLEFALKVRTLTVFGFLRLRFLAKLKALRRRSLRFAEEQAAIEAWLALVTRARAVSPALALQTAELARLVKGYGDTYRRGQENYRKLVAELVEPALNGGAPVEEPAAQLRGAIAGALASAPA